MLSEIPVLTKSYFLVWLYGYVYDSENYVQAVMLLGDEDEHKLRNLLNFF